MGDRKYQEKKYSESEAAYQKSIRDLNDLYSVTIQGVLFDNDSIISVCGPKMIVFPHQTMSPAVQNRNSM